MRIILYIWMFLGVLLLRAQETQFSQFFASSAFLNPGFVGLQGSASLAVNYKSGFGNETNALKQLTQATFIQPIQKVTSFATKSAGVGLTFMQERRGYEGLYQTTNVLLYCSYVLGLDYEGKRFLSFGMQGGVIQNKLNFSDLKFGSQYNPYFGYDDTLPSEVLNRDSRIVPTFNAGVVLHTSDHHNPLLSQNSFLFGLSIHNINRPDNSFIGEARKPMQVKAVATARRKISSNIFIHPSGYILAYQGSYQLNGGLYLSRYLDAQLSTLVQLGAWYRYNDSFILLMGVKHKQFKTGVSVDFNSTLLSDNEVLATQMSRSTFEVSFTYDFAFKNILVDVTNPLF